MDRSGPFIRHLQMNADHDDIDEMAAKRLVSLCTMPCTRQGAIEDGGFRDPDFSEHWPSQRMLRKGIGAATLPRLTFFARCENYFN